MAVLSQITCTGCGVTTHVSHRPGDAPSKACNQCRRQSADEARTAKLNELAALPIEERIARIEAWIHDYRPPPFDTRF